MTAPLPSTEKLAVRVAATALRNGDTYSALRVLQSAQLAGVVPADPYAAAYEADHVGEDHSCVWCQS